MPGGFGGQQQQQQQSGRAVSNRLPNGKIGEETHGIRRFQHKAQSQEYELIMAAGPVGNAAGWAFSGMPMGGSASVPPGAARQIGGNVSFAQSLAGSQPATPLDLS